MPLFEVKYEVRTEVKAEDAQEAEELVLSKVTEDADIVSCEQIEEHDGDGKDD